MITDSLKTNYIQFQNKGEKAKIVELLTFALKSEDLTDEERCWALWNISDSLAILRKSDDELANHKLFEKQISQMDLKYIHWIVSDATQKLTLLIGGYEDYWFNLYKYACHQSAKTSENKRIRFESHRASIAIPAIVQYDFNKENSLFALENMKNMLSELKDDYNYKFYELTYFTQHINLFSLLGNVSDILVEESLRSFLNAVELLSYNPQEQDDNYMYLLGSWEQLNGKRSKFKQGMVVVGNYIISLVDAEKYKIAINCYEKIIPFNLFISNYFNNKIQFAKSQSDYSK